MRRVLDDNVQYIFIKSYVVGILCFCLAMVILMATHNRLVYVQADLASSSFTYDMNIQLNI